MAYDSSSQNGEQISAITSLESEFEISALGSLPVNALLRTASMPLPLCLWDFTSSWDFLSIPSCPLESYWTCKNLLQSMPVVTDLGGQPCLSSHSLLGFFLPGHALDTPSLLPPVVSVVYLQMFTELDSRFLRGGAFLSFLYPPGLAQNFEGGSPESFTKACVG